MYLRSFTSAPLPILQGKAAKRLADKALRSVLMAMLGVLLLPAVLVAQSIQYTQNKPDQALRSAMRVDPSTLGLSIEVPLGSYPGRGTSLPINLSYSSKQWRLDFQSSWQNINGTPRAMSQSRFSEWAKAGWATSLDIPTIEWTGHLQVYNADGNAYCVACVDTDWSDQYYINRIQVHMPGGGSHELRTDDTRVESLSYAGTYFAVDGSNIRYEASSDSDGILYLPDGSRYLLLPSSTGYKYIDRNGNTLSYSAANRQWTDTQGRVLDVPVPASPTATTYTYYLPSTTSTPLSYSVRWSTLANALTNSSDALRYETNMTSTAGDPITLRSPYLFSGTATDRIYEANGGLFNPIVPAQITLPNGQSYLFTYNVWGEVTKVVYPTGGYERFDFGTVAGVSYLKTPYNQANRGVVDRWLSPTGSSGDEVHWHYASASSSGVLTVSTTAPDNTLSVRLLTAETSVSNSTYGFSNLLLGMAGDERGYAPSGAMLQRTLTEWATSGPTSGGWGTATRNPRVTKQVSILLDTGTANALTTTTTMSYDDDLNLTATNHYDFTSISQSSGQTSPIASISAGSLLRTEEATYLVNDMAISSTTRTAYRARSLLSLPTSTFVKDGLGTIVAQTQTSYDETSSYPLLTYGGAITGWTDPATNLRGLPTTQGVWLNTTSSYLQTHAQYDQFGNVRNTWDAKGNQSQLTYSSTYSYTYPTSASTAVPDSTGVHGSSSSLTTSAVYNANTGLMTSLTDANSQTKSYSYDSINRLSTITPPSGGGTTTYDYGDTPGNLYVRTRSSIDSSREVEAYQFFDGLGRVTRGFLYDGTASTPWLVTDTYYDNMGRVSQVSNPYRVSSPSAGVPASCSVCTTSSYDALSRVISMTTPDNAQVTTSYGALSSGSIFGTTVLVTDQAGRKRRSLTDSLGRLVRVDEPDVNGSLGDVSSPVQPTSYSYDVLGNLHLVTQGAQQRFFLYDSISRLLRARNPEQAANANLPALTDPITGNGQWSTAYTYDNNGNLTQKTDARNVTATYAYDALNRNTTIDYSDTTSINPDITHAYDGATNGKGRLWESYVGGTFTVGSNVEHTKVTAYDALGRPLSQLQEFKTSGVWSSSYITQRQYNLTGAVTLQTYPSGHSVSYNYDQAGRLGDKDSQNLAFTGSLGDGVTRTYSRGISYSPFGSVAQEQFGTDTAIYNKLAYNARGQLAEIKESTTPNDSSWNRGKFINWYSLACGGATCNATDNNGNLRKQENFIPNNEQNTSSTSWDQQYEYDSLNRLQRAHEYTGNTSLDWQQEYVYDRYGNRRIEQDVTKTYGTGINKKDFTANAANGNRLSVPAGQTGTMAYDNAGNLTTDSYSGGAVTRAYDAENRMTSETQANNFLAGSYTYNADGQRVRRKVNGVETWQVYGMDGELLAEYAANAAPASPQKEYGYRNGQLLITAEVPVNVALTANGASSSASSSYAGQPSANVNNGERKGLNYGWWTDNSSDGYPDWVEVDFAGAKTINEIDVIGLQEPWSSPVEPTLALTARYALTNFEVQYWTGSAWVAVPGGNIAGNNKVWRKFSFDSLTTSKIRVYVTNVAGDNHTQVVELEAWTAVSGSTANVNWLVTDQLGTPRMIFDKTGALANVKRHDYLPFGEDLFAGIGARSTAKGYSAADGVRQKFTQKERDNETGLDYFGARYYSSTQGRFTSADPFNIALEVQGERDPKKAEAKLQIYLSLPQQWNRYSYAINNPLVYVDPTGEAIQLSSDPQERERQLQALKDAVGSGAAGYLYANQGSDGNWYVGVYDSNPTNGDTRTFGQINDVASQLGNIIADPQVAKLEMVNPGEVTEDGGRSIRIGRASSGLTGSPGATGYFKGQLTIKLLDWGRKTWWGSNFDLGYLPGALMSDGKDNMVTPSAMTAHELSHAWDLMCGNKDRDGSNQRAVDFENKVRNLQNPNGPTRRLHNVPTRP